MAELVLPPQQKVTLAQRQFVPVDNSPSLPAYNALKLVRSVYTRKHIDLQILYLFKISAMQ